MIDSKLEISNENGYIKVKDTSNNSYMLFDRITAWNDNNLHITFFDGRSYLDVNMRDIISPAITNNTELNTWVNSLSLKSSDVYSSIPARTVITTTTEVTISAGFLYLLIEAPNGVGLSGCTIDGTDWPTGFTRKEFTQIQSGSDVVIDANGHTLRITEVRK